MNNIGVELKRLGQQLYRQGLILTAWAAADKLARWFTGGPVESFSKITDSIWLGGQPTRRGMLKLFGNGFTAIVNMRAEYDYSVLLDFGPVHYLHLPTEDNEAPSLEHLSEGARFIEEEERRGKVYIHCWEGLGRGPTLVAAYLVRQGLSPEAAWDKIRDYRPFIRPTDLQIERLKEFDELVSVEKSASKEA